MAEKATPQILWASFPPRTLAAILRSQMKKKPKQPNTIIVLGAGASIGARAYPKEHSWLDGRIKNLILFLLGGGFIPRILEAMGSLSENPIPVQSRKMKGFVCAQPLSAHSLR